MAFGVVVLLIVLGAAAEWARLIDIGRTGRMLFVAAVLITGAVSLWIGAHGGFPGVVVVACGAATLFWVGIGVPSVLNDWQPASPVVRAVSGWLVLEGAFVAIVALHARSAWLALAAMAIVWIADTAAYFAGRRFGRRKLAPAISPGKTWEGAYGALLAVVVYALLLLPLAQRTGFAHASGVAFVASSLVFAVAVAALSIAGDLFESLLKRRAGVKDSGAILPGHGGILDRIDALLAAMPPVALAAAVLFGMP